MRPDEEIETECIRLHAFRIHIPVYDKNGDSNWDAIAAQERVLKERLPWRVITVEWPDAIKTWWRRQAARDACDWMNNGISVSPTKFWENYEKENVR